MKHFIKKHKHHFGIWVLSGIILIASVAWRTRLNGGNRFAAQERVGGDSSVARQIGVTDKASLQVDLDSAQSGFDPYSHTSSTAADKNQPKSLQNSPSSTAAQVYSADSAGSSQESSIPVDFVIALPQETRTLKLNAQKGSTVYDAMKTLARAYAIDVQFKEFSGLGAMVQSIGGVANDTRANKFWIYYINGALAKAGVSFIKINSNDVIKWNYEAGK